MQSLYRRSRRIIYQHRQQYHLLLPSYYHASRPSCEHQYPYHQRQVQQQISFHTLTVTVNTIRYGIASRGGIKQHKSLSIPFCSLSFQQQRRRSSNSNSNNDDDRFIQQIEVTIDTYVQYFQQTYNINILCNDRNVFRSIPKSEREEINIIRYLDDRIRSMKSRNICLRCWYVKPDCCICNSITEFILPSNIHRIFILTHYKEIGMISDTMKLLLCTYPNQCRLVIGGLFKQHTMDEMMNALQQNNHESDTGITSFTTTSTTTKNSSNITTNAKALVLFPSSNAVTFQSYYDNQQQQQQDCNNFTTKYDIIVIDATWDQARRLYNRHMVHQPTNNRLPSFSYDNIQLSNESLQSLRQQEETYNKEDENHNQKNHNNPSRITTSSTNNNTIYIGQQLRPHPISIRQIATAHAVQLLLHDMITVIETTNRNDEKYNCQDTTGTNKSDTTKSKPSNVFSLELHYKQRELFHQYQQLAMNMALRNKQCPSSTR